MSGCRFRRSMLSLILMVGLGVGLRNVILAIVLVDWTRFCRVMRGEVLVVARKDYVAAARLLGFSHWRTITREIVPATPAAADHAGQPGDGHRGHRRGDLVLRRHERQRADAGLGPDDRRCSAIYLRLAVGTDHSRSWRFSSRCSASIFSATACAARSMCA